MIRKETVRKIWKRTWQTLLTLFLVFCILEVAYRYQWIDFFKPEFKALNQKIDPKKPNVLVFGDSFTAHPDSYVEHFRKEHPEFNFINCAMPGSGPYEMELMASGRVSEYPPDVVIYQMYVGNDLTDIDPPVNWGELSFSRNCYWSARNYFSILGLFSRRITGVQTDFDKDAIRQDSSGFDPRVYSPRTKMMIRAESDYLAKCVNVSGKYKSAMEKCTASIRYLREIVPAKTPIYIVIVPHFSQVSEACNDRYKVLSGHKTPMNTNYAFARKISGVKGVDVINPLRYFRAMEAEGKQLYFNNDPHLTGLGQRVLFEYMENEMKKEWK